MPINNVFQKEQEMHVVMEPIIYFFECSLMEKNEAGVDGFSKNWGWISSFIVTSG